MFLAKIMRILRNKLFIGIALLFITIYAAVSIWSNLTETLSIIENQSVEKIPSQEFRWGSESDVNGTGSAEGLTCRNSVQGKVLIADDQGYVCHRVDRLGSGCCNTGADTTQQYACDTCNDNGCCAIYEYCVSCCLHPDKKVLLKKVLGQIGENSPLYASVSDHFELCLVRCRTSSQSVQHETIYRDPRAKHCYGEGPPPLTGGET